MSVTELIRFLQNIQGSRSKAWVTLFMYFSKHISDGWFYIVKPDEGVVSYQTSLWNNAIWPQLKANVANGKRRREKQTHKGLRDDGSLKRQ